MDHADEKEGSKRQIRNGVYEAFAARITRYQQMIHSLAFRMTGSLAEADDLTQDTFIQAFRRLEDFRGEAKFSTWLYRIALNISLNWKKSASRRSRLHQ